KHLVAFTLATGGDLRLLAAARPCVTQGAPLGKAGLIFKEDQTLATRGSPENRWPLLLQPGQALGRVEMIRYKTGLLKRNPQVVEQRTHIMTIVEHPELAPDQHPDEDGVPAGRLTAYHEWSSLNQLDQSFPLLGGQLGLTAPAMVVDQALDPVQQEVLAPPINARGTQAPSCTEHLDRHVVHKQVEQHGGPPDQPHIIALIGVLQTAVEVFDGCATQLYPDRHGCILLSCCSQSFFERYTRLLSQASPHFPIHFLKIYL